MNESYVRLWARFVLCFCLFLSLLSGCNVAGKQDDSACIVVGSTHISPERLKRDMAFICAGTEVPDNQKTLIQNYLLEQCINHYLTLEYAKENGISLSKAELDQALHDIRKGYSKSTFDDALLRGYIDLEQWEQRFAEQMLVEKTIKTVTAHIPQPTYEEIKSYFEANPEGFKHDKILEFQQIVTMKQEEAEDLLKRLQQGEDMAELAREYSVTPEAENGGKVGWIAEEDLDESMMTALSKLPLNKFSPVVKTPYGFHIFRVLGRKKAGTEKLSDKIEEIKLKLFLERSDSYIQKWLLDLKDHFEVKINHAMLKELGLP